MLLSLLLLLAADACGDVHPVALGKQFPPVMELLVPQRQNVVCFYSGADPICRALYPGLLKYGADPKLTLHMIDVGAPGSRACRAYGVTTVPSFQIYNKTGELVSEGAAAYRTVTSALPRS